MKFRAILGSCLLLAFTAGAAAAFTSQVNISDGSFSPFRDVILLGDTVKWKNFGTTPHTSTGNSNGEVWDSGLIAPGGTWQRQFNRLGTFNYTDTQFGFAGQVVVVSASPTRRASWGSLKRVYRKGHTVSPMSARAALR